MPASNLVIRGNKKYPDAMDRFKAEILTSSIFNHLKETNPALLENFCSNKLNCIGGEITEINFGLPEKKYLQLAESTDVFINSAASVNFQEELDKALLINTLCLNNVADFAEAAGDIPVIQISTCYVNGFNKGTIKEEISKPTGKRIPKDKNGHYDTNVVVKALQKKIEKTKASVKDKKLLPEALTELGLKEAHRYGWGDTYTFTKWLGEQLILKRLNNKTITILRPSVVESTLESPIPGWIEGVKVSDAILLAYARQKVSFFPARKAGIVDIIPVDLVANSVILSVAEAFEQPGEARIYQSCSGSQNPLKVERYVTTVCEEVRVNWKKYPNLAKKQPEKKFVLVNKRVFISVMKGLKLAQTVHDRILSKSSTKSKALKTVESTLRLSSIYSTYTSPEYVFNSDKLMALSNRMGEQDKVLFPVDAKKIDWDYYFQHIHVAGLNRYGMEDNTQVSKPTKSTAVKKEPETEEA
ncbi:SDR family oxidoreductase [Litoribacillus peritrichatus]|uniref:Alcohol-forming fatty acyl-CoA reductase n=1 Tax=Litoribacillus peritrichatus TaxID=718191 RepID=A0ABP7M9K6_9GAMM